MHFPESKSISQSKAEGDRLARGEFAFCRESVCFAGNQSVYGDSQEISEIPGILNYFYIVKNN